MILKYKFTQFVHPYGPDLIPGLPPDDFDLNNPMDLFNPMVDFDEGSRELVFVNQVHDLQSSTGFIPIPEWHARNEGETTEPVRQEAGAAAVMDAPPTKQSHPGIYILKRMAELKEGRLVHFSIGFCDTCKRGSIHAKQHSQCAWCNSSSTRQLVCPLGCVPWKCNFSGIFYHLRNSHPEIKSPIFVPSFDHYECVKCHEISFRSNNSRLCDQCKNQVLFVCGTCHSTCTSRNKSKHRCHFPKLISKWVTTLSKYVTPSTIPFVLLKYAGAAISLGTDFIPDPQPFIEGGFCSIYHITPTFGTSCPPLNLKSLPLTSDQRTKDRFLQEIALQSTSACCPLILPIYFVGYTSNYAGVIVPALPSDLLNIYNSILDLDYHLQVDLAEEILYFISSAISYLHGLSMSHNDVKMENILIGTDGHVLLCDCGLASIIDRTGAGPCPLNEGEGTNVYIPPELFTGPAQPSTDSWALGALLLELLAGRRLSTRASTNVNMLKKLPSSVPTWLTSLIRKSLLETNPLDRILPSSFTEEIQKHREDHIESRIYSKIILDNSASLEWPSEFSGHGTSKTNEPPTKKARPTLPSHHSQSPKSKQSIITQDDIVTIPPAENQLQTSMGSGEIQIISDTLPSPSQLKKIAMERHNLLLTFDSHPDLDTIEVEELLHFLAPSVPTQGHLLLTTILPVEQDWPIRDKANKSHLQYQWEIGSFWSSLEQHLTKANATETGLLLIAAVSQMQGHYAALVFNANVYSKRIAATFWDTFRTCATTFKQGGQLVTKDARQSKWKVSFKYNGLNWQGAHNPGSQQACGALSAFAASRWLEDNLNFPIKMPNAKQVLPPLYKHIADWVLANPSAAFNSHYDLPPTK